MRRTSHYAPEVWSEDELERAVDKAISVLNTDEIEFDFVACCGLSGVMFAQRFSFKTKTSLLVVRKKSEYAHGVKIEGHHPENNYSPGKVLVVDDFPDSWGTVNYTAESIAEEFPQLTIVGVYFYHRCRFYSTDKWQGGRNENPF